MVDNQGFDVMFVPMMRRLVSRDQTRIFKGCHADLLNTAKKNDCAYPIGYGYFLQRLDKSTVTIPFILASKTQEKISESIDCMMFDEFGIADIKGSVNKSIIALSKQYRGAPRTIDYNGKIQVPDTFMEKLIAEKYPIMYKGMWAFHNFELQEGQHLYNSPDGEFSLFLINN